MGRNVEFIVSFGGLHEKHAVQRGVLGNALQGYDCFLSYSLGASSGTNQKKLIVTYLIEKLPTICATRVEGKR
jgi:hypothetical protein